MTYPLSSPVSAGDPTEASQYNNLRQDALFLGGDPAGSGNLQQLLFQNMGTIRLSRLSATTIQLSASESDPCGIMIGGTIFAVTENLTVLLTHTAFPALGRCYVYAAAQSDGTFILDASYNTVLTNARMIGTFLWDGNGIIPGTLHNLSEYEAIRSVVTSSIANGRLTLASGVPVPDTDIEMSETLYFTPYNGNEIALYIGEEWEMFAFTELSLDLSGMNTLVPYDIFITADSGGLKLSAGQWGSATARLTGLIYHDGVKVSMADYGKRYLGTIVLNSSGYGEDSQKGRLLWNENNRVGRPIMSKLLTAGNLASNQNLWTPYDKQNKGPEVRLLVPDPDTTFDLIGTGLVKGVTDSDMSYSRFAMIGIGQDMNVESPYTGNTTCVPIFTETYGNGPVDVRIRNSDSSFRGYHRYTLAFHTNFSFNPAGMTYSSYGAGPGLHGVIWG